MKGFCGAVVTAVVMGGPLLAADPPPEATHGPVTVTLRGAYYFGDVEGFMQTPSGGKPSTSSHERPTFDELNIHDVSFYEGRLDVKWRHLDFFGGYQYIRLDGDGTFSEPLVSRGVTFAAGDPFDTKNQFDWYRVGAGWQFDFLEGRLAVMPKLDFALLDFSYKLSSGAQEVDRSYSKGTVRPGVEVAWRLTRWVSLHLDGSASVPISNTPQIADVIGTVQFDLLPGHHRVKPTLFVGGGAEWIDYEDDQPMSNHIKANLGPFVTAGLSISF
jgi:hypothetical protein